MTQALRFFVDWVHPADSDLTVAGLACQRGLRPVFENLSFSLAAGQALALYGANGSGKTSLLRQLAGFLAVDGGQLSGMPPRHYLGHADGLKAALTVEETLAFETRLQSGQGQISDILATIGLAGRGPQMVGDLSAGQRRRLALARLITAPRPLWLLDEPLTALDMQGAELVDDLAAAHLAAGGLIVAASHSPLAFATKSLHLDDFAPPPLAAEQSVTSA